MQPLKRIQLAMRIRIGRVTRTSRIRQLLENSIQLIRLLDAGFQIRFTVQLWLGRSSGQVPHYVYIQHHE
ncbi:unnamed protein product [Protopolystoma xenopodis]|uniref:Uncharacterized protein n=1 Tax=Protopolystoma xenopodis TaxID=117903 RepID=A0A448WH63_9PLAT|nr:unnamed protein product [Protopolystoma xenopodis]